MLAVLVFYVLILSSAAVSKEKKQLGVRDAEVDIKENLTFLANTERWRYLQWALQIDILL
jgi:hypothetical protein